MRGIRSICALMLVAGLIAGCECCKKNKDKEVETSAMGGRKGKSLYDRLGGEPAIKAVVDDFVPRAASDSKVNFTRKGIPGAEWQATPENVEKLKIRLVQFIGEATGGPQKYVGKDMKTAHKGMKITNAEFDAIAADLKASLDKLKVSGQEQAELLGIVETTRADMVEIR